MTHANRFIPVAVAMLFAPAILNAQEKKSAPDSRIASALMAAPQSIATGAAVLDWPATPGGELVQLRPGTNGWSCLPDFPVSDGEDPMCLDEVWLSFVKAQIGGKEPKIDRVGIGYMIHGGAYSSNDDPTATKATADNDWGYDPPHVMVVVPDVALLAKYPKDRGIGPYVMFAGTPYAHLMVPVVDHKEAK